jgi:hypothetical protein
VALKKSVRWSYEQNAVYDLCLRLSTPNVQLRVP